MSTEATFRFLTDYLAGTSHAHRTSVINEARLTSQELKFNVYYFEIFKKITYQFGELVHHQQ